MTTELDRIVELLNELQRKADLWERLHDARTSEIDDIRSAYRRLSDPEMDEALRRVARLTEVLEAHRRFHKTVGCPGRPECYVCAEEEFRMTDGEEVSEPIREAIRNVMEPKQPGMALPWTCAMCGRESMSPAYISKNNCRFCTQSCCREFMETL